ncbi:hypothetical protein E3Q10_01459 [Wallemia mellicola]|uniref:Rieske domain-containing protein n=1 Tax=Wallemia mellicola TaxID=1708541 RepID=A0A4T0R6C0_9BASI|nr:hypothetical protein E3Q14_00297 [Wallemia mellicola]TIC31835.1 hypothetical protein E3Q10_01459 [Wallemia mellicola]TIC33329.1 hypothetical protein E3Q11_00126 [Wallemia mellicola]TIC52587.1 hypothetical protein E3Q05_02709 [Wallemia mellicola]
MPSAVPISAGPGRDDNGYQPSPRSFRSMGGFGGRSFSAQQGLSFTGPGTSLGKSPIDFEMHCGSVETENGLPFKAESEFCKNYNCCGMELKDLHDLIQHYEEAHVVVLDDSKKEDHDGFDDAQVDDMDLSTSPSSMNQDSKLARMSLSAMAAAAVAHSDKNNDATSAFETSILHSNPRGAPTSLHAKAPLGSFGPPFSPNLESEMSSQPTSQDDDEMFDAEPSSSMSSHSSQAINAMPLFPSTSGNNGQNNEQPQCVTPGLLFPTTGAQRGAADAAIKAYNNGNNNNNNNLTNNNSNPPATSTTPLQPSSSVGTPSASGKVTPTSSTPTPSMSGVAPAGLSGTPVDSGEGGNDKPFKCPNPGCSKAYRQANGLKYHRLHGQCNYVVRDGMEQDGLTLAEAEAVARPYLCQVGHCDKRYKNMNGLRYHYAHSGAHGAIGLAMLSNGTHPTPPPAPAHVRERKDRERKAVAAAAAAAGLPPPQSPDGDDDDNLLAEDGNINIKEFYALESNCPHAGAPMENASLELVEDDIEDVVDVIAVCPYHAYDISLSSGESSYGVKACTFEVQLRDNEVYINTNDSFNWEVVGIRPVSEEFATSKNETPQSVAIEKISGPEPKTLAHWAVLILKTADPELKIAYTRRAGELFKTGKLRNIGKAIPPEKPPRSHLREVDPSRAGKRGKAGSLQSRIALLHSLANIELWAVDLAWDIIARFSASSPEPNSNRMPMDYFSDWLQVALDEAKHFSLLRRRLEDMGSYFGALPVHGALWDSAEDTKHSLISRLSIIHLVHEARGLDVNPATIEKFRASVLYSIHLSSQPHQDRQKAGLNEGWYNDLQGEKSSTYKPTMIKSVKEQALQDAINNENEESIADSLQKTQL